MASQEAVLLSESTDDSRRAENKVKSDRRFAVLDGWRGISILCVLASHLLPLGPKALFLNETAGPLGMVLFFNLSGFLIASTLLDRPEIKTFFIRRACRILPLAFLFIIVALTIQSAAPSVFLQHLCFYVNYDPSNLTPLTSPLWSLCVEIHFYVFVGLLAGLAGRSGLFILPLLCLGLTGLRAYEGATLSLITHLRVDEILAGATLALVSRSDRLAAFRNRATKIPLLGLMLLLLVSCHPASGPVQYLRPYFGASVIAVTLWGRQWARSVLESRILRYCADVSYALYVIHPVIRVGWFASGGVWERYLLKRPIGFVILFLLAHISTFYYEKRWIAWGKRMAATKSRATRKELAVTAVT